MIRSLVIAPLMLLAACATTHSSMSADNTAAKAQFDMLRSLEGDWVGPASPEGQRFETSFRLTGGGTTVEETMMKGTPHEMTSMYHLDGDRLMHTHYCAAGNQPRMVAEPSEKPGEIEFEFLDATNLKSMNDMHMHSMRLVVVDKNHIEETWRGWVDGKPVAEHDGHFELSRKSPKA